MSRLEAVIADATLCADVLAMCACELPKGHSDAHACSCGGSWDADGEPITFPELTDAQREAFFADMFLIASELDIDEMPMSEFLSPVSPDPQESPR